MPIKTPSNAVNLTGAQTVAGVKTFSSSPIVPTPTTDYQASTKKYVDDAAFSGGVGFGGVTAIVVGAGAAGDIITWATAANLVYGDLVAVCDETADESQINAAITALSAGRTWIETVKLIGNFTCATTIVMPSYTRLDLTEAYLYWDVGSAGDVALIEATGTLGAVDGVSETDLTACAIGASTLTLDEAIFAAGDYAHIRSEDTTVGFKEGEIHRVRSISALTITLDSQLWNAYTTTPHAAKITPVQHIEIIGGNIVGAASDDADVPYGIYFRYVVNAKMLGTRFKNVSANNITVFSSMDIEIAGISIWGAGHSTSGYGVCLYSACNAINFHDNKVAFCRHCFTMGGLSGQYGAPVNVKVHNNTFSAGRVAEAHLVDCHAINAKGIAYDYNNFIGGDCNGINGGAAEWSATGNIFNVGYFAFEDEASSTKKVTLRNNTVVHGGGVNFSSTVMENLIIDGLYLMAPTWDGVQVVTEAATAFAQVSGVVMQTTPTAGGYDAVKVTGFTRVLVTDNHINESAQEGILVTGATSGVIANNVLSDNDTNGLTLTNCSYLLVTGNACYDSGVGSQNYGIRETGTSDYNTISNNKCYGNVTAQILLIGAATKQARNDGYRTTATGTATVASGQTHIDVAHGLVTTPTRVIVTPTLLSDATHWWVTGKGATEFIINVDQDPGAGTATFDWYAVVGEAW